MLHHLSIQLSHIKHLVEYRTGLDARIGLPIEHLANARESIIKHPMFSTGIGLIMTGYDEMKNIQNEREAVIGENLVTEIQNIEPENKREKVKEEEVIERMSWGKKLLGNVSLRIEKYLLDSNDVKDFE